MFIAHHSTKQIIISGSVRDHNSGGGACGGNEAMTRVIIVMIKL